MSITKKSFPALKSMDTQKLHNGLKFDRIRFFFKEDFRLDIVDHSKRSNLLSQQRTDFKILFLSHMCDES